MDFCDKISVTHFIHLLSVEDHVDLSKDATDQMGCNLVLPISWPPLPPSLTPNLTSSLSYRCIFFIHASNSSTFSFPCVLIFSLHSFSFTYFSLATDSLILKELIKRKKQQEPRTPDPAICIQNTIEKIIFLASWLIFVPPVYIFLHTPLSLLQQTHAGFLLLLFQAPVTSLIRYILFPILPHILAELIAHICKTTSLLSSLLKE